MATSTRSKNSRSGANSAASEEPLAQRIPTDLVAEKIAKSLVNTIPDMSMEVAMQIASRAVFTRDEAVAATAEGVKRSRFVEDKVGLRFDAAV